MLAAVGRAAQGATGRGARSWPACDGAATEAGRAASRACSRATTYRALLRRARVFVTAPRREDYGIAQLEALADGCMLVTTPSPGPYAALPLARELDPRLVGEDSRTRSAPRSTTRARLRGAGARRCWRRGGARRSTRSWPSSCCRGYSLARMTPISGQSVLITGAAHGIGAEVARRLAARGRARLARRPRRHSAPSPPTAPARSSSTPTSPTSEALDAAVAGTVEAFGGIDTCSPTPASPRPASSARWTRRLRARHRGQPDRRLADDPRLPAARHRAPRLRPARRLGGRDPPAVSGAYAAAKSRRRGARPRAARRAQRYGVDVGVAYFSWIDTEMVRGADRTELGARMRAMLTGPLARALARRRRGRGVRTEGWSIGGAIVAVPRLADRPDVGSTDPPRLTEHDCTRTWPLRRARPGPEDRERGNEPQWRRWRGRGPRAPRGACLALRPLPSGANSAHGRVFGTCSGVNRARRAVAIAYRSNAKFFAECASVLISTLVAAERDRRDLLGEEHVLARQVGGAVCAAGALAGHTARW